MPSGVRRLGRGRYVVYDRRTGRIVARATTRANAEAFARQRDANSPTARRRRRR